jgi:hypothetical protein
MVQQLSTEGWLTLQFLLQLLLAHPGCCAVVTRLLQSQLHSTWCASIRRHCHAWFITAAAF